jgi:hypothetical protein
MFGQICEEFWKVERGSKAVEWRRKGSEMGAKGMEKACEIGVNQAKIRYKLGTN